ncbi:MAG: hypothetical protein J6S21_07655 [Victivallales bacterium]|nr:hypothetical protein [Victivallales bacterium]
MKSSIKSSLSKFDGRFTPEIRRQLNMKRLSLGLSLQQLGDFLQVNWSTIRKWECGQTTICHPRHICLIRDFLAGAFDGKLSAPQSEFDELAACWHKLPPIMHSCLERITMIYELCEGEPELRSQLLAQLNTTARDAVQELAGM